ncbi:MAG: PleD family two-component system response regulator [Elusimicrobiota bacterium]
MGLLSGLWGKRRAKILVVDDTDEIRDLIRDLLTAGGYDVTAAVDGVHGLVCFQKEKFDLVILDVNMPRMAGTELLQVIRAMPDRAKQPVIMLSAEKMLDPIYLAYEQGIIEWIPKPFAPAALLAKVAAALKAQESKMPPKKK